MGDFTFLTLEQSFNCVTSGISSKAAITDFAILLGGFLDGFYHIDDDNGPSGRTGYYWTKSDDGENNASAITGAGGSTHCQVYGRNIGARPVLPLSSVYNVPTNGSKVNRVVNGVREVEYGYYPKSAADKRIQNILNQQLNSKKLQKTGNSYTTDSVKYSKHNTRFKPQIHEEYEYNGKRYVRVKAKFYSGHNIKEEFVLSNGEKYNNGDYVWVEVEPVKWIVDEKEKIMITKDIIFAGVQFNYDTNYKTENFDTTDIKKFMDNYLKHDLIQQRNIGVQNLGDNTGVQKKEYNPYGFDFGEVSETDIIESAIRGNVAIFLHGKPGCGKSDRVKQLDSDFIELNLSHLDPELLDGLAGEKDGKAVHIKPPWLEELEAQCEAEPDKIHILFLEELTNASPMMQTKAYGIALDKKVAGRWNLPEQVRVVAAGNELEDSLVTNELAEPLYDRFAHVNIETTAESWLNWAVTPEESYKRLGYKKQDTSRPKIHPAIYAYIKYKGDEVLRTPYNRGYPEPHADPRRWKMASDMLYATNKPWTLQAIVGEDLTRDFIAFCQIPTLSVEDVIKRNYTEQDFVNFDLGRQLALVTNMLTVDSENMPTVRKFLKKHVTEDAVAAFESQWIHGDKARSEQIAEARLEEQEESEERTKKGHTASESNFTRLKGILHFEQIDEGYSGFLYKQRKRR